MTQFWIISILLFILITLILAKFTLKNFKNKPSEKMWKLWDGRATYWQILGLCSFGITVVIVLTLKWLNILSKKNV